MPVQFCISTMVYVAIATGALSEWRLSGLQSLIDRVIVEFLMIHKMILRFLRIALVVLAILPLGLLTACGPKASGSETSKDRTAPANVAKLPDEVTFKEITEEAGIRYVNFTGGRRKL